MARARKARAKHTESTEPKAAAGTGATEALFCPKCGTPHEAGDTFCAHCGGSLEQPAATAATPEPAATPAAAAAPEPEPEQATTVMPPEAPPVVPVGPASTTTTASAAAAAAEAPTTVTGTPSWPQREESHPEPPPPAPPPVTPPPPPPVAAPPPPPAAAAPPPPPPPAAPAASGVGPETNVYVGGYPGAPPGGYAGAPPARKSMFSWQVGMIRISPIAITAGVLAIVASLVNWSGGFNGFDYPFKYLWTYNLTSNAGFKLGIVVLVLGIAAMVMSLLPLTSPFRRLVGLALVAIGVAFFITTWRLAHATGHSFGDVFNALGTGPYLCAAAGVLTAISR